MTVHQLAERKGRLVRTKCGIDFDDRYDRTRTSVATNDERRALDALLERSSYLDAAVRL